MIIYWLQFFCPIQVTVLCTANFSFSQIIQTQRYSPLYAAFSMLLVVVMGLMVAVEVYYGEQEAEIYLRVVEISVLWEK